VPRPVTGSHPFAAENPVALQPGFVPFVISWRICGFAYKDGFTNPTVDLLTARRSSLMRLRIDAKTGADADVPPTGISSH
jgi:hypothetical protein